MLFFKLEYISIDKIPFIHRGLLGSLILTDSRTISIMQQREDRERRAHSYLLRCEYMMLIHEHELVLFIVTRLVDYREGNGYKI